MAYNGRPPTPRQQADAKFAASERHDAQFFRERKEREAANLAKTLELRKLRLAKEAVEREAAKDKPPSKAKAPRAPKTPPKGSTEAS